MHDRTRQGVLKHAESDQIFFTTAQRPPSEQWSSYWLTLTAWIRQSCHPMSAKSASVQVALDNPEGRCGKAITGTLSAMGARLSA